MPRSANDQEYSMVTKLIDSNLEPEMRKMIERVNQYLKKYQLNIAATIDWAVVKLESKELKDPEKTS